MAGLPFGYFMALPFRSHADGPRNSVGFVLIGALTALIFWLIWRRLTTQFTLDPDPDQSAK
jgi:hypothetical protein